MTRSTIEVDRSAPVAGVTLNRPEVRNAFNAEMIRDLTQTFQELAGRPEVRVVVLSGAGPSFSAGADINWMRSSLDFTHEENLADANRMSAMFHAINSVPQAVIGRVHGAALGGGMGLIAVCDVVVAAEGTVFGFTEAKLGIVPAVISPFVVPKIGPGWARSLFLSAERFGPEVAQRIGLVHWITPLNELDQLVESKVNDVLAGGPEAVRQAKSLIERVTTMPLEDARRHTAQLIGQLRAGDEGQAGLRSFLEKQKPPWTGDR